MAIFLDELENHLFGCADIIRDAVDPTDYKEKAEWLEQNSARLVFSEDDV